MLGVVNKLCWQCFVDNAQQCFAFTPQANFPAHNLNFHWRRRDWIQATFYNFFYFKDTLFMSTLKVGYLLESKIAICLKYFLVKQIPKSSHCPTKKNQQFFFLSLALDYSLSPTPPDFLTFLRSCKITLFEPVST